MKKLIIIIGGGFAGIQLARHLDRKHYEVLLIDKLNHHQFQPLFYQVATSQIEPSSISFPLRNIFRGQNGIQIRLAEVQHIHPDRQTIQTDIGIFRYDELVVAAGCKTNFFGNKEIEKNAFTLKSTYDAIAIRNHILHTFERVLSSTEEDKKQLLNLVIVGAGPTGVELAGAFAEIKRETLPKDYPGVDFSRFSIYLVEGSPHTLHAMSDNARSASSAYLRSMGVHLLTNTVLKSYDGRIAQLSSGEELLTATVIWAAGVTGNFIDGLPAEIRTPSNRISVDRASKVKGLEHIYAIGDLACMETPLYPKGHPQVANVAISQAKRLAANLNAAAKGKPMVDYEYKDLGSMATIGRNKAVVDLPFMKFKGYFAWLTWMFLHLMLILSVRNKLIIFINWAWAYITRDSSLRLILRATKPGEIRRY